MPLGSALAIAAATTVTTVTTAPTSAPPPGEPVATVAPDPVVESGDARRTPLISEQIHDAWLVSLEAATHLPIDAGFQLGVETPFGLRLFGGYGWVPAAFIDVATRTAGEHTSAGALLASADYSGQTARVTLGLRPFRKFGGYLDAGFAHAWFDGSKAVPAVQVYGVNFEGGSYRANSQIDLWLVELGYQAELSGRLVLAGAVGLTGAIDARTRITPESGAQGDPALANTARDIDHTLESHILPTLTLRIGFDLI